MVAVSPAEVIVAMLPYNHALNLKYLISHVLPTCRVFSIDSCWSSCIVLNIAPIQSPLCCQQKPPFVSLLQLPPTLVIAPQVIRARGLSLTSLPLV